MRIVTRRMRLEKAFDCKFNTMWAFKKVIKDESIFNPPECDEIFIKGVDPYYEDDQPYFFLNIVNKELFFDWLDLPLIMHPFIDYKAKHSELDLTIWSQDYAEELGNSMLTDDQRNEVDDILYAAEAKFEKYYKSTQKSIKKVMAYYLSDEYLDDVIQDYIVNY